jgi:hypothetical protein
LVENGLQYRKNSQKPTKNLLLEHAWPEVTLDRG